MGNDTAMPALSLVLGIETTCDETAAAVVASGDAVLSSVVKLTYSKPSENPLTFE